MISPKYQTLKCNEEMQLAMEDQSESFVKYGSSSFKMCVREGRRGGEGGRECVLAGGDVCVLCFLCVYVCVRVFQVT